MIMSIDLTAFPQALADQLGITLFAGQICASLIVLLLAMLPVVAYTRGKNQFAILLIGLVSLGFVTAVGWLPYWFMVIIVLLVAFLFSGQMRSWITRGG